MNKEEIMNKINKGELTVSENSGASYIDAKIKIEEVTIEEAGKTKIDHPLLKKADNKGRLFLAIRMMIKSDKYPLGKEHIEVGSFLTKAGQLAIYPTSITKIGDVIPGTLLYDIVHASKDYDARQAAKFASGWTFTPDIFKGLVIAFRVKYIEKNGNEYVILETSRQKLKDEEYKKQKSADSIEEIIEEAGFDVNAEKSDLPF